MSTRKCRACGKEIPIPRFYCNYECFCNGPQIRKIAANPEYQEQVRVFREIIASGSMH